MIHSLTMAHGDFKRVIPFKKGLNLIAGIRTSATDSKKTCNSLGKSSVHQVIDFCLGANVELNAYPPPKGMLPVGSLDGWEFTLEFDLCGSVVKATRSTLSPGLIDVVGDDSQWPIKANLERENGAIHQFELPDWRMLLGATLFKLPVGSAADDSTRPDPPTYRQLFGYFCRRSFGDPLKPVAGWSAAEVNKSVSFLLGLDWCYVSKYSRLDAEGKNATATKKGVKVKLQSWNTKITPLRSECKKKRAELSEKRQALADFRVEPHYHEYEVEADGISRELSTIHSRLVSNRRGLTCAKNSLENESAASVQAVRSLYEDASVVFSPDVIRSLSEVEAFQRDITQNRREFLKTECTRLRREIKKDEAVATALDERRSQLLRHLSTCGALEQFKQLEGEQESLISDLSVKSECITDYDKAKEVLAEVKEAKESLIAETKVAFDTDETKALVSNAETTFRQITSALYEIDGTLGIEFLDEGRRRGYKFTTDVKGSGGGGVNKMRIFAFDLTLLLQQKACGHAIDFLLHDGEVFESSDLRQRASALKLIHKFAKDNDLQYITGMNLDNYPSAEIGDSISLDDVKVLELRDSSPAEKLFGFDFEASAKPAPPEKCGLIRG